MTSFSHLLFDFDCNSPEDNNQNFELSPVLHSTVQIISSILLNDLWALQLKITADYYLNDEDWEHKSTE